MKINKLFVLAAVCGSTILASCDYQAGLDRQRAYTKATLADNDAFNYIKLVGEEAVSLVALTQYADSVSSSAQVKALHAKVKDVYITLLPELDSVATALQVDFPVKGIPAFEVPRELKADSTATFNEKAFFELVQQRQANVNLKTGFETKNTNKLVRDFAASKVESFKEIYTLAGGKEAAHAHH